MFTTSDVFLSFNILLLQQWTGNKAPKRIGCSLVSLASRTLSDTWPEKVINKGTTVICFSTPQTQWAVTWRRQAGE